MNAIEAASIAATAIRREDEEPDDDHLAHEPRFVASNVHPPEPPDDDLLQVIDLSDSQDKGRDQEHQHPTPTAATTCAACESTPRVRREVPDAEHADGGSGGGDRATEVSATVLAIRAPSMGSQSPPKEGSGGPPRPRRTRSRARVPSPWTPSSKGAAVYTEGCGDVHAPDPDVRDGGRPRVLHRVERSGHELERREEQQTDGEALEGAADGDRIRLDGSSVLEEEPGDRLREREEPMAAGIDDGGVAEPTGQEGAHTRGVAGRPPLAHPRQERGEDRDGEDRVRELEHDEGGGVDLRTGVEAVVEQITTTYASWLAAT